MGIMLNIKKHNAQTDTSVRVAPNSRAQVVVATKMITEIAVMTKPVFLIIAKAHSARATAYPHNNIGDDNITLSTVLPL